MLSRESKRLQLNITTVKAQACTYVKHMLTSRALYFFVQPSAKDSSILDLKLEIWQFSPPIAVFRPANSFTC